MLDLADLRLHLGVLDRIQALGTAYTREAERIHAIFDREEQGRRPPYGRALDVGCGTGLQAVELVRLAGHRG